MKTSRKLLWVALIPILMGFDMRPATKNLEFQEDSPKFYFPLSVIDRMQRAEGMDGIRFYSAFFQNSGGTLMAVATSGGADLKGGQYYVFEGIQNGRAIVKEVDRSMAEKGCEVLGQQKRMAVTFSVDDINKLKAQENVAGLALLYTKTESNDKTLSASPAVLQGDRVLIVNRDATIAILHPCPSYCGNAADYLSPMK